MITKCNNQPIVGVCGIVDVRAETRARGGGVRLPGPPRIDERLGRGKQLCCHMSHTCGGTVQGTLVYHREQISSGKRHSLLCSQPFQLWRGHGRRQGRASMVAAKVRNVWERRKHEWRREQTLRASLSNAAVKDLSNNGVARARLDQP